jgi:uncharacterized protein
MSPTSAPPDIPPDWESLCIRCGECCFEKWIEADGTIIPTGVPCRYLDIVTRQCKVYHKRLDVGEECMLLTPEVVRSVQWLPPTCGYVQHLERSAEAKSLRVSIPNPESRIQN